MLTDSDLRKQLDQALSPEAKAKLSKLSSAEAAKKASEQVGILINQIAMLIASPYSVN